MPRALPLYILTLRPTAFVVAQAGMVLAEGRGGPGLQLWCRAAAHDAMSLAS